MNMTKITKEEIRQMVRESVRRKLKEKLLGEAVNVRAGTDIILAAEKEWHDFVYNVICKQLGLAGVETMPDDMGNKILAVIKSEWPSIRSAVSSAAEKLSGFPKEGESNSVTNIQNPGMVAEGLKAVPKEHGDEALDMFFHSMESHGYSGEVDLEGNPTVFLDISPLLKRGFRLVDSGTDNGGRGPNHYLTFGKIESKGKKFKVSKSQLQEMIKQAVQEKKK